MECGEEKQGQGWKLGGGGSEYFQLARDTNCLCRQLPTCPVHWNTHCTDCSLYIKSKLKKQTKQSQKMHVFTAMGEGGRVGEGMKLVPPLQKNSF